MKTALRSRHDATAVPTGIDSETWQRLLGLEDATRKTAVAGIRDRKDEDLYVSALCRVIEDTVAHSPAERRAAGNALALLGDPRINTLDPPMVRIPGGPFLMGTRAEDMPKIVKEYRYARVSPRFIAKEMPQHEVEVGDFEIGRYLVTNAEYGEFVKETGREPPVAWYGPTYPDEKANHPVVRISHDDAIAYSEWLSGKTGRRYRLPTETEWEKAARGTDGRLYPWGNEFEPDRCNTLEGNTMAWIYKRSRFLYGVGSWVGSIVIDRGLAGDRFDRAVNTTTVGVYPDGASPYGVLDMAGNAEEWTADWFWLYPGYPFGDQYDWSKEEWVCRGGAWNRPGDVARTARRHGNFVGSGSIGLRLARDVQ